MNGAMISGTSTKHKNTNTSTAEAESKEAFHASIDVAAMRGPMRETGLPQTPEFTTIYCDNTAATQIMESKGTIGKRSKAMDAQNPCAQKNLELLWGRTSEKPRVMVGKDLRKTKNNG